MITTCTGCRTRYRLDDAKVPRRLIRVRCPRCQAVFLLDGTRVGRPEEPEGLTLERSGEGLGLEAPARAGAEPLSRPPAPRPEPARAEPVPPRPAPAAELDSDAGLVAATPPDLEAGGGSVFGPGFESGLSMGFERAAPAAAPSRESSPRGAAATTAPAARPAAPSRRSREKEAIIARALVSDILVYNREKRDRALQAGTLLEEMGPDIKKSWELYKERVTPEVANGTTHFRDALNDILAEGKKVF